jgi:hypothetical protein
MKITGTGNRLALSANGKRCPVYIMGGPWIEGVNPNLIKVQAKKLSFPAEIKAALNVENDSDSREDYFVSDTIRILPGHPLYATARAVL